ncbi:hypothetical protein [Actinoplanes sp. URMC 104]|uniref:hypothetical protein n=1 Tax=Actinoplanes sp. URMC 104 TaxID=3423409 RepID=UPI003F1D7E81
MVNSARRVRVPAPVPAEHDGQPPVDEVGAPGQVGVETLEHRGGKLMQAGEPGLGIIQVRPGVAE